MKKLLLAWTAMLLLANAADAATYRLPSNLKTVRRGIISPDSKPVLTIKSGDTVVIDTVSHGGLVEGGPVKYFAAAGIAEKDVLKDAVEIMAAPRQPGFGGHVLTGPIHVQGAEPGDMLEIRIKDVKPRVPYGVNNAGSGGAAPGLIPGDVRGSYVIKYDPAKRIVHFSPEITVPLRPFMGIMANAPAKDVPSGAPGQFGGNMDFQKLQAGATLYLPVLVAGALFVTGDPHAAQGNGEVSGNALEASMTPTLQFILHKGAGKDMSNPVVEDKENFYIIGQDPDLDKALTVAIKETVKFLGKKYGMSLQDAYSLCSTALDFGLAQAVDGNLTMYGTVPKAYFSKKFPYWR
jgi:acetamidase/formamidase